MIGHNSHQILQMDPVVLLCCTLLAVCRAQQATHLPLSVSYAHSSKEPVTVTGQAMTSLASCNGHQALVHQAGWIHQAGFELHIMQSWSCLPQAVAEGVDSSSMRRRATTAATVLALSQAAQYSATSQHTIKDAPTYMSKECTPARYATVSQSRLFGAQWSTLGSWVSVTCIGPCSKSKAFVDV